MFGLVRRRSLIAAEKRNVDIRIQLTRTETAVLEARAELRLAENRAEALAAEVDRLVSILTAHPVEPAEAAPAKAVEAPEPPAPIRMLTGLEVVNRATLHRNTHNKAVQGK